MTFMKPTRSILIFLPYPGLPSAQLRMALGLRDDQVVSLTELFFFAINAKAN